jgi:hypothetical protein
MNFNDDAFPDLYVTNWDQREDEPLSKNSIFVNNGEIFKRVQTNISGGKGSSCLDIADINGDQLDDIVSCSTNGVRNIFTSTKGGDFKLLKHQSESIRWKDANFSDMNGDGYMDLISLGRLPRIVINYFSVSKTPYIRDSVVIHLPKSKANQDNGKTTTNAVSIATADINNDGFSDIYVARRRGGKDGIKIKDVTDLIFLGPDWESFIEVPAASSGRAYKVYGMEDSFLVLNAGPNWEGSIDIVSWANLLEQFSNKIDSLGLK